MDTMTKRKLLKARDDIEKAEERARMITGKARDALAAEIAAARQKGSTLAEIGELYGVTRQRILQITGAMKPETKPRNSKAA